ncbi:MAG: hypothetical protein BGO01_13230 [Armatimonadetes bacterium 55-13]|nr:YdeI/OmpD-associated family protein [Armatimonadota bacterium]OJU61872.1 MAG: hypothetical protein BGO01_13230 [Armatimonadetes bacterium 55-13]
MKSEWAPFDDREFDCHLYEWVDEHVGGRIWPADWKAVRLHGVVPIRVCVNGRTFGSEAIKIDYPGIYPITHTAVELGIPRFAYSDGKFSIDWDRAAPDDLKAALVGREAAWRALGFEAICDFLNGLRRKKTAVSRQRAIEGLVKMLLVS